MTGGSPSPRCGPAAAPFLRAQLECSPAVMACQDGSPAHAIRGLAAAENRWRGFHGVANRRLSNT